MDKKSATSLYTKKKTTSSEYKLETESNIRLAFLDQQSPPPTPPPLLLLLSSLSLTTTLPLYTMSQYNINLEQVVQ